MKMSAAVGRVLRSVAVAWVLVGAACTPATRSGPDIPHEWKEVSSGGWTMTVPAGWEFDPVFRPDSPTVLLVITRPSWWERRAALPTSPPPTFHPLDRTPVPVPFPDPYLTLIVLRLDPGTPLEVLAAGHAERPCPSCTLAPPAGLRAVAVHGRPAIRADVIRADGSREWGLVVQNACHIFDLSVNVRRARAAELADTVERIVASVRVADPGLFGC